MLTYVATCMFGLEKLLGEEIDALGLKRIMTMDGRVLFSGEPCDCARANVNLRVAERVYVLVGEAFPAPTFDALFEGCRALPWENYIGVNKTVFIANPNAPTGIALSLEQIERIVESNPDNVVIIDEAYVDFGAECCIPLVEKYDNLLVVNTFSKSRSFAGGRVGFAVAQPALIADLETIRNSINPYNVNSLSQAAAHAILQHNDYYIHNCKIIAQNRQYLTMQLDALGFTTLPSATNFVFTKHPDISGEQLYLQLKQRAILVRYFNAPRIHDYCRITIGTREQVDALLGAIRSIL